ncbi:MAG: UDP-3-O-[3-hydroxymyristoyl] N-acetylglucosamine deacetylase [Bacteroidaceae bacterium]|nr:UDP-3-O-[3-hydroxymyristoyl] N-acetylglucosamine deacetylase [Bacteroidaceae bacterium]
MEKQHTINQSFTVSGKGLHTGLKLTAEFCPAPANFGYKIQRTDIEGHPIIECLAENVVDTQRGTVISNGTDRVSTIEHALSALYALGIDNCLIRVNGPEIPILDGSAAQYVQNIQRVGKQEQEAPREYIKIEEPIEYIDDKTGSHLIIEPCDTLQIKVNVTFDNSIINNQCATMDNISQYPDEIAASRTFVFVRDIENLLQMGLIKGGDLDNAIVIYERQLTQEKMDIITDIMKVPRMDATHLGYIMHRPLVWDNEPARHKLLDIIGDMALCGHPILGSIKALKPGHRVNNQLARMIRAKVK